MYTFLCINMTTQGIVSVDSEYISLDIDEDGIYESYRSIRFDAAIYSGNSGGGLFNTQGGLIGITNAVITTSENICYAIPLSIVSGVADNIIYYANDGDDTTQGVYAAQTGLTLEERNAKYSLDSSGYGAIIEDVYITAVESGSLAEDLGLAAGDRPVAVTINGTRHELTRSFELDELLLTARAGDEIVFTYERDGQTAETQSCTLSAEEHLEAA